MREIAYYTENGLKKILDELNTLKVKERTKVAKQLSEARQRGDLSENAEYDAAKEAQALLELKIGALERVVAHARVISKDEVDTSQVSILTKVTIKHPTQSQTFTYTIVSEEEADITEGKISIQSPIGKGLLGKRIGDTVTVNAPSRKLVFEILDIGL